MTDIRDLSLIAGPRRCRESQSAIRVSGRSLCPFLDVMRLCVSSRRFKRVFALGPRAAQAQPTRSDWVRGLRLECAIADLTS